MVSARQVTSKRSFRRIGQCLVAIVTTVGVLGIGAIADAGSAAPAGAATVARDGLASQTAAPSCWSIKQAYPASADGIYWLWTPKLVDPQQFYCDMTTAGGGWVLVGRGREGWSFPYAGQGSPSTLRNTVTGTGAFTPASLPTETVDGLLNDGRMDALPDGVRLRRATNTAGTTWQEVRLGVKTYNQWSWAFGAGIYLGSISFDGVTTNFASSTWQTNTTADVQVANDTRRITTYPLQSHNYQAGFSFGGSSTTGQNNATSYLWQYASEGNAVPFTQVFVRPQISESDIVNAGVSFVPDSGTAASTVSAMLNPREMTRPWAVTDINLGTSAPTVYFYVKTFAQIGNTIYVGGKFRQVQHGQGGPAYTQSYLAAFDKTTGEWIPGFNPVIDGPVWKLKASPDGTKLFVGGEFTNVNGVANTSGLAALDPTTGAPLSSWVAYTQWPSGSNDVRAMDIQGDWLYLGGSFTRIAGGATDFVGPLGVSRLARVRLSDGRPDWNWTPSVTSAVWDLNVSQDLDRVYVVGAFNQLNGVTISPTKFGIVNKTNGATVTGLQPYVQNSTNGEENTSVLEVGDHVYVGGAQHFLHSYRKSDFALERSHIARSPGGDFQAIAYNPTDGKLYASCHCDQYQYEDSTAYAPSNYSRVDQINLIGAYDTTDNLEVQPEFHPVHVRLNNSHGEGPWSLFVDSGGCMWAGGDIQAVNQPTSPYYGGFTEFCPRDTQAPSTPPNLHATTSGNTVTLTWNPSTDNSTDPLQYEILRDDPELGTIVEGTTYDRTWTDTNAVGAARYFLRTLDATGNRSASTPVTTVTTPPPVLATLIAHGDTWSYRADGQNLGSAWRQPATDTSAWTTGSSQLGWGGKGETTTIAGAAVTDYFVKHVAVADASAFKTLTVRLKRDDGAAVYVNGVEVVRDNLPAGTITASTVASSFTSGVAESSWFEYTVPGALLTDGDNTIAVELHQAQANNADGIFDLELVAHGAIEAVAPSTPVVSVGTVTFSAVPLSWTASTDNTGVAGYLVRRDGTPIAFTPATSLVDSGLTSGVSYTYDVTALDTSGNLSTPGVASATTVVIPWLVKPGDPWSYRADGVDLGTAWRQPAYNSSAWASGPSQLGWGNRGESTVVPSGQITQYFVRHFTVADPGAGQLLALQLKRDDGAAVYLNGTEIARSNLPAGTLTAGTYPTSTATAADATTWRQFTAPAALLNAGDNVVAVELHQDSRSDTHAVFDLGLNWQTPAEQNPPTRPVVTLASSADNALSLQWTAATDDTGIAGYVVRRNGVLVAFTTATSLTDTGLAAQTPYGYEVTAVDTSGNSSTPGLLAASTTGSIALTSSGDVWSYRSNGTDPGTAWRQPSFDASSWSSGPSQLGWGGRGETTVVPSGQITQYYVRHFVAPDPSTIDSLVLRVKRDDGIAVYVNGTEVVRDNLPAGTLTAGTYPTTRVTAADGVTWKQFTIPTSALVAGDNTIAAEVHQDSRSDSRAVFDLTLAGTVNNSGPVVTISSPAPGGSSNHSPMTLTGLCTSADGPVAVAVGGAQSLLLGSACVANGWSVTTPLGDGAYTVTASQTDGNGVIGSTGAIPFTVDTASPTVTITAPTGGVALASGSPQITGQCSTGDGSVSVAVTGAAARALTATCSSGTFTVTPATALPTGAYSVTASQTDAAGNTGTSAAATFSVDVTAPVTTNNTAAIGNGWKTTPQTVTLSATDVGVGVAHTYFTTDGSTPTVASPEGTTITLSTSGTYTIKYFSVDALGNAEAVKTAATQIRIDTTAPASVVTFPVNGASYNAAGWSAGCSTANRICGTASDANSGIATVRVTLQRASDSRYWSGSSWVTTASSVAATGTTSWSIPVATSSLTNGVTYTATVVATDVAGNAVSKTAVFGYDTTGPSPTASTTTNKNGAVQTGDTVTITFGEALNPATVPATGTLTLSRSRTGSTTWGVNGFTNGQLSTGATGYLRQPSTGSYTVTYVGALALSNGNTTVTFTVTGACAGSCSNVSTTASSGSWAFTPTANLRDLANNAATGTRTASSSVMF